MQSIDDADIDDVASTVVTVADDVRDSFGASGNIVSDYGAVPTFDDDGAAPNDAANVVGDFNEVDFSTHELGGDRSLASSGIDVNNSSSMSDSPAMRRALPTPYGRLPTDGDSGAPHFLRQPADR